MDEKSVGSDRSLEERIKERSLLYVSDLLGASPTKLTRSAHHCEVKSFESRQKKLNLIIKKLSSNEGKMLITEGTLDSEPCREK